jgi:S1-C subfamily serine protease
MSLAPVDYRAADVMDTMMLMMMNMRQKPPKKVLAPATVWGLSVEKENGDEEPGVNVKQVLTGSPAAAGGLKAGDRLLVVDATWTDSVEDCYRAAAGVLHGQTVKIRFTRGGREYEAKIRPFSGL